MFGNVCVADLVPDNSDSALVLLDRMEHVVLHNLHVEGAECMLDVLNQLRTRGFVPTRSWHSELRCKRPLEQTFVADI